MLPAEPTNASPLSVEQATNIMRTGKAKLRDGAVLHVFVPKLNSELPQIATDELIGHDIVVISVKGKINGKYGPSFVCEVAAKHGPAQYSWLINEAGVLGQQLQQMIDAKALPFWCSVHEKFAASGSRYHTFDVPGAIVDALPKSDNEDSASSDLADLPF